MIAHAHIPKTGGTTLKAILRRTFGFRHFDTGWPRDTGWLTPDELRRIQIVYRDLRSLAGHGISPTTELCDAFPDIRYYTFLRDPIRRTISDFQFRLHCEQKKLGTTPNVREYLREFMAANHNRQTKHLAGIEDADAAIEVLRQRVGFVGLVEHFDESLVMLKAWADMPNADFRYKSLNVSANRKVDGQYLLRDLMSRDENVAAELEQINREDMRLMQFVRDEVFPSQRADYGKALESNVKQFQESNARVTRVPQDTFAGKAYRNFVYKPLRRWLLPDRIA